MVDPIKLTKDFIDAANAFLKGGDRKKPDFFAASDADQTLVDRYSETPDARSGLGELEDGVIGVRYDKGGNVSDERVLVHTGQVGWYRCPVTGDCTPEISGTYDPARVAAFFAARFGFTGLHEGDPRENIPGQMQVLRETKLDNRVILDQAMTAFGGLTPAPEQILITEDLRSKINVFLRKKPKDTTEFITAEHVGKYLVPKSTKQNEASGLSGDTGGVIGIITQKDGSITETLLTFDGRCGTLTCTADYAACEPKTTATFPKEKVLMLQAALFGFASLYDTQLLENFAKGGAKERAQRVKLDEAFALFTVYRKPVAVAKAPEVVIPPPPVAPPPVAAPPVVAEPTAPPPVEEKVPAVKMPPPTAEVPAVPPVVPAKPTTPPAPPVAEPKSEPTAPPTATADGEQQPLMEYVADAVERLLKYGRDIIEGFKNFEPAPADTTSTVTYEPLLSPAEAITVGAGAWGVTTGLDYLQTAWRLRQAYAAAGSLQPVTAGVVMRGAPARMNIPINGIRFRTLATGALAAVITGAMTLIPIKQSEVLLTVQSDLPADE